MTDASVLVNFLRIDRMDLIAGHSHAFLVTDHVADEVSDQYPNQQQRFASAVEAGAVSQESVKSPAEIALFGTLSALGRLGAGECSAIAVAVHRRHMLAIDDRRATIQARRADRTLRILTTQDLMVSMIGEGPLGMVAALAPARRDRAATRASRSAGGLAAEAGEDRKDHDFLDHRLRLCLIEGLARKVTPGFEAEFEATRRAAAISSSRARLVVAVWRRRVLKRPPSTRTG